ncbi:MAG TPA: L-histidine N(alpha)-methyltransferase [Acidimicrobiales bacterium]|nr:L-histidine N(alpha)-methyltransferase [Acidimicrobiales bacterium]
MTVSPHFEVHLTAEDLAAALRSDVRAGLGSRPRELPAKWFYDERGCALFEEITRLPEYYPTRREREILAREAAEIARLTGADTLVELGSGTSEKTRILLDAMAGAGQLTRIVLFDVSEPTVRAAAAALAEEYPGVEIHGVVGDFERHLHHLPGGGRRLVAFFGGTIGNLGPVERKWFLGEVAADMVGGDALLLGTDLVKDRRRLEAAYDDAAGVTAAFNRNVLVMLNRELGADFDIEQFAHEARFDPDREWMDIRLRATSAQTVTIVSLGMTLEFDAGETIRTEISTKFRRKLVEAEITSAGLELARWWTDERSDYAVSLSFSRQVSG